jgi:carboxypeptidase D
MVWIDQHSGAGFSLGPPTAKNRIDVANQFNDFWKRFVNTFDLNCRKGYLTRESYAGQNIPYIASEMLDKEDPEFFNMKGIRIIDPAANADDTMMQGRSSNVVQPDLL